jgi:hypothetical protein
LRRRATIFGNHLLRLLPENRRTIERNEIFGTFTYEHFKLRVRAVLEQCRWMLAEGRTMEPDARAKFYGRRLGNRGRKLRMLSQLELIDWDAMNRIIDRENEHLCERSPFIIGRRKPPAKMVAIDLPQAPLAARDRMRTGLTLKFVSGRLVFSDASKRAKQALRSRLESSSMAQVVPMPRKPAS